MSLIHEILGGPGRDNALFVRVESGQRVSRLLFDCGDGCLNELEFSEIQSIDHLFFSHLHMDHVGGFDSFFRCNFNRQTKANVIWGPPGTSSILHHRFQGFLWNLVANQHASWRVNDIETSFLKNYRYELDEAFSVRHDEGATSIKSVALDQEDFSVTALHLTHHGRCLGYLVREKPKVNIRKERLTALGLKPGPWMKDLKSDASNGDGIGGMVTIDNQSYSLEKLRAELLAEMPGESIAYLTDFILDDATLGRLTTELQDCQTLICESQYRHQDLELAQRNHHTTVNQVARLATAANVGELILFHLSDRYTRPQWREMLAECREVFERARFPSHWNL